ncbi:hypothetical protein ONZ45_g11598 [Pleurotus djamor]|nr:hypothetical protein ONZ45_g11598 [Pleurotus djamor]
MTFLPFFVLLSAIAVFAIPAPKLSGCNISNAKLPLPAGQTGLVPPTSAPSYISVAIGVQNYTCTDAGTFTSAGAVAELFDISCLYGTPAFNSIEDVFYAAWKILPKGISTSQVISLLHLAKTPTVLGQHYFITNPITGSGISPIWDFTSQGATKGNTDAFVVGARLGGLPAPTGSKDVDWLLIGGVQGKLADQIYRVDTVGGQPPASCKPGSTTSVKYASKYWLMGGSIAA